MTLAPASLTPPPDCWSQWLLHARHGGDFRYAEVVRQRTEEIRDRLLDGAQLTSAMTLVDVGTGDGLIAFGALARLGPTLRVILTDLSAALLAHTKQSAGDRGWSGSCTFVQGSAEKLKGVASASADVVATRAVLAYVADKPAALREFHRVLKPGGRLVMAEPVLRDNALEVAALSRVLEGNSPGANDRQQIFLRRWLSAQFPSTAEAIQATPITNYTERDLVGLCQAAGFGEIHLEFHVDMRKKVVVPWETYLDLSPHPQAPTLREILATQFSEEERQQFVEFFRPLVESDLGYERDSVAYLTAIKPE